MQKAILKVTIELAIRHLYNKKVRKAFVRNFVRNFVNLFLPEFLEKTKQERKTKKIRFVWFPSKVLN